MKTLAIIALSLLPTCAFALDPVDPAGRIFGVEEGVYQGGGKLESLSWSTPNVSYESLRKLSKGVIEAKTKATLLGFEVAAAQANLKIQAIGGGKFELLDMDANGAKAGEGQCESSSCSFKATVMKGELTLEETWVANENGFDIVKGAQVFKGKPARYEGKFERLKF